MGALGACTIDSDYGGGLLSLFEPAYLSIEFPDYDRQPCSVACSLDGGPYVSVGSGIVLETTKGPHSVSLGVGGGGAEGCGCEGSSICQIEARKGKVTVIRLHRAQGSLCCPTPIPIICFYSPAVVFECPQ
jgi:hypothetical protein